MSDRTKRVAALEEDIERDAKNIFQEFKQFTTGVRYLCLLHRTKDGGENKEFHRRGGFYVTHTPEDYLNALEKLLIQQAVSSKPYRLYGSVNERDLQKGEKLFKIDMLDADFSPEENKGYFYRRLESKWGGSLMKPSARATSYFLLDADGGEEVLAPILKWLGENKVDIIKQYKTPNGWHIITTPFNPNEFKFEGCEIKKDALLLLNA